MARGIKRQSGKQGGQKTGKTPNQGSQSEQANEQGAIEMLKEDHRKVEELFQEFEHCDDNRQKEELARHICRELIVHTLLEEQIFYPAVRECGHENAQDTEEVDSDLDEAQVEHDSAKMVINELLESHPGAPFWEAHMKVLKDLIEHHVEEEEKPGDGTFALAEAHGLDDEGVGRRLRRHKQELQRRGGVGTRPLRVASFSHLSEAQGGPRRGGEEDYWNRARGRDTDEYYRQGAYGEGGQGGRQQRGQERGQQEGQSEGWYGDPRGRRGYRTTEDEEDDVASRRRGSWWSRW